MMTNEQMPQGEAKKPLTKKICVQSFRKACREEWPGIWVGYAIASIIVLGIALLLFWWPYWPLHLLGVLWLIMNWYLGMGHVVCFVLTICGVCRVSKDVMCGGEIRTGEHGTEFHYFCFSHHGSFPVSKWMYENIPAGQMFYIVSVPGAFRRPVQIYPTSKYEWVGKPDQIKDYTRLHATQGYPEDRVENTVLARRPLTRGRKWTLTDEEIARDLLENRALTKEHVLGAFAATAVLGGLLFFIHVTAAIVMLAGGGALSVLLLAQYLWFSRQVKKRSFIISSDTLMDKDPVKRGFGKNRETRYVLGFRKHPPYVLPPQDESVYRDAELGDTFYIVRFAGKNFEGKKKTVRAVYNALDVECEIREEEAAVCSEDV